MKQHRDHAMSECNKATQQEIQEASQSLATSCGLADMQVGRTMSHLNEALAKAELISQVRIRCAVIKFLLVSFHGFVLHPVSKLNWNCRALN